MKKVILIIGPSGSGKTVLQEKLKNEGFEALISSTTREIRIEDGEKEGVDYYFKRDKDHFFEDSYVEFDQVADQYYGTSVSEFIKKNKIAHVIEPFGANKIIQKFKNDNSIDISVVYMNIDHEQCVKNLKGKKGYLSEKDQKRLNRDIKDSIHQRIKDVNLPISLEINALSYSVKDILTKLSS